MVAGPANVSVLRSSRLRLVLLMLTIAVVGVGIALHDTASRKEMGELPRHAAGAHALPLAGEKVREGSQPVRKEYGGIVPTSQGEDFQEFPPLGDYGGYREGALTQNTTCTGILRVKTGERFRSTGDHAAYMYCAERSLFRFGVKTALLRKVVGDELTDADYVIPATVTIEHVLHPFGSGSASCGGYYAVDIREHAVPYDLKELCRRCTVDFEGRYLASHPSALRSIETALRTDARVKEEDRKRDVEELMRDSPRPGLSYAPEMSLRPDTLPGAEIRLDDYYLAAGRLRNDPFISWGGAHSGFSVYCGDRLAVQYIERTSLGTSRLPFHVSIIGLRRYLSVAYDFGPEGNLKRVRVHCPTSSEARALPVTEALGRTSKGAIPGSTRSPAVRETDSTRGDEVF